MLNRFVPFILHSSGTYSLYSPMSRDCAGCQGDGRLTIHTWVRHSWSFKGSWGDGPQIARQLVILWGSDERNRPKTGQLTCPPSCTVLKLRPEFQSPVSQFTATPTGSQLGQQELDRGMREESDTKSTMVATSLHLPQKNNNHKLGDFAVFLALTHAL